MKLNFALIFLFFAGKTFAAGCGYSISAPALTYTASDVNPTTAYPVTLSRTNAGGASCNNFTLGFSKGGSNSYNRLATNSLTGATLAYNLFKTSTSTSSLKLLTDASSNAEVLSGTISKNSSTPLNYYFKLGSISSIATTRGGTYQDIITIQGRSGTYTNDQGPQTTQTLSVNIIVPKIASLSLVNTGGVYDAASTSKTLDFGELTANEELSFDVIVLSNAGYQLSVSSANNQLMKLSGGTPGPDTQINYNFYANSVLKNLTTSSSTAVLLSNGSGVTPAQGARVPIRVVIQSVDNKDAGIYQDYLTFTVATTE